METLSLRVERINENTMALAKWLKARDDIKWVDYIGLEDNEYHAVAKKYMKNGYGGMLTFAVKGVTTVSITIRLLQDGSLSIIIEIC